MITGNGLKISRFHGKQIFVKYASTSVFMGGFAMVTKYKKVTNTLIGLFAKVKDKPLCGHII